MFDKLFKGNILKKIEKISKKTSLFCIPSILFGMNQKNIPEENINEENINNNQEIHNIIDRFNICFSDIYKTNYILDKYLGSGAYGEIISIKPEKQNKKNIAPKIALKIPKKPKCLDYETYFHNKIKNLGAKNSILKYYGYFSKKEKDNSDFIICLEYCDCGDLSNFVKKFLQGSMSKSVICYIIGQISCCLFDLYKNKILHSDLKPWNILIDDYLNLKLCDFSTSRILKDDIKLHETTYFYNSPESLNEEKISKKEDLSKPDIFSLGVIIYYLITHKYPFIYDANNKIEHIENIINKNLEMNLEPLENKKIPPIILDFMKKTLRKDINERSNIKELMDHPLIKICYKILIDEKEKLYNANKFLISIMTDNLKSFNDEINKYYINEKGELDRYKELEKNNKNEINIDEELDKNNKNEINIDEELDKNNKDEIDIDEELEKNNKNEINIDEELDKNNIGEKIDNKFSYKKSNIDDILSKNIKEKRKKKK